MKSFQNIKAKDVASYICLPGIIPRLRAFGRTGFDDLAFLMANIYGSVRLLPPNHPYLNPANKGRFGMRNVIGEAYSRLVFKKENIDQIVVFGALVAGFVLMVLQFAAVAYSMVLRPTMALAIPVFPGMFATPDNSAGNPSNDIALMLLDSVFGIPGLFTTYPSGMGTCIAVGPNCGPTSPAFIAFPTQFQIGLHSLFNYYNLAILLISCLVFLYYILVIVAETAQTGTPFGKRFDHIWAPIRLVVALGLLVPLNYGMNSAQYIALYAAKLGSGFATNGWNLFNSTLVANMTKPNLMGSPMTTIPGITLIGPDGTPLAGQRLAPAAEGNVLIARPKTPDVAAVAEFMSLVWSCKVAYETLFVPSAQGGKKWPEIEIDPYFVKDNTSQPVAVGTTWQSGLTFYQNKDIVIRFGQNGIGAGQGGTNLYDDQTGNVKPLCGEIVIATKDVATSAGPTGADLAEQGYFDWIKNMYFTDQEFKKFGVRAGCIHLTPPPNGPTYGGLSNISAAGKCQGPNFTLGGITDDHLTGLPPVDWKTALMQNQWQYVNTRIDQAYVDMLNNTNFAVSPAILDRGWGGAGIWYNQLAEWNGALFSIVETIPAPSLMPDVMEKVQEARKNDKTLNSEERYEPNNAQPNGGAKKIDFDHPEEEQIARELSDVYKYWENTKATTLIQGRAQGNIFYDAMHMIFGVDGLLNLQQNSFVNPLAMLVAIGKSILDGAIRNLIASFAFSFGGGMFEALDGHTLAGIANAASMWLSTFATIGLSIGFTLYYVLPFMPFLYFYFAVGAWVKTVFEAMVGVPLWAMAHLKIDGVGLPGGEQALNGYFLIFEIFIRPILTVFGLLASISVFSALVRTLDGLWPMVTDNITGYDCSGCAPANVTQIVHKHGIVDEFFYTVMYTILVYLMATSCFKLIDQVPESIMRWMGSGVSSFADQTAPPGDQLASYAAVGAQQVGGALGKMSQEMGGDLGGAAGGLIRKLPKPKTSVKAQGS